MALKQILRECIWVRGLTKMKGLSGYDFREAVVNKLFG